MITRALTPLLLALTVLFFAAACGGDADDSASTSDNGTTENSDPTTETPNGTDTGTSTSSGTTVTSNNGTSSSTSGTSGSTTNGTSTSNGGSTTSESSTEGPNTLAATLRARATAEDAEYTWLVAALDQTGLMADLENVDATLTLFAPNDSAFEAAAEDMDYDDVPDMLADATLNLDTLLLYHVLGMTVATEDIVSGSYSALAGGLLWLVNGESLRFNNTEIALTDDIDVETVNGRLHGIDGLLRPLPTIAGALAQAAEEEDHPLADLADAIEDAEFSEVLNGAGPFTVFAPDNDAFPTETFAALPLAERQEILDDHIANGLYASFAMVRPTVLSRNGFTVWLDIDETRINDADLDADGIDLFYANGVVHIIDGLLEPLSLPELLGFAGLDSLQAALDFSGLDGTFAALANRTLFAPTDTAFEAYLDGDEWTDQDPILVEELLRFHLWEPAEPTDDGNLTTEILGEKDGDNLTMSNGENALIDLSDEDGPTIGGAPVNPTLLDIVVAGNNGADRESTVTIHVLDGVMEQP